MRSWTLQLVILIFLAFTIQAQLPTYPITLSSIQQAKQIPSEGFRKNYVLHGRGIITSTGQFNFVQDETGGIYFKTKDDVGNFSFGDLVKFEGMVRIMGAFTPYLEMEQITVIGTNQPMPKPEVINFKEFESRQFIGLWVQISGVVQSVVEKGQVWELDLASEGTLHKVSIKKDEEPIFYLRLLDKEVEIQGTVLNTTPKGPFIHPQLLVPSSRFVTIVSPPFAEPTSAPPLSLSRAQELTKTNLMPHQIRVFGKVVESDSIGNLVLENGTTRAYIEKNQRVKPRNQLNQWIVADGFPSIANDNLFIRNATVEVIGLRRDSHLKLQTNSASLTAEDFAPVLNSIQEIREFPPEVLNDGFPVHLIATVTLVNSNLWLFFVQDQNSGIFVFYSKWPEGQFDTGTKVEITGFTSQGLFSPIVVDPKVKVLGPGEPPNGLHMPIQNLHSGQFDSCWVTISGLVRSVDETDTNGIKIELTDARQNISIVVTKTSNMASLRELPGRKIAVSGVCVAMLNNKKQFVASRILVPAPRFLTIIQSNSKDTFKLPVVSVKNAVDLAQNGESDPIHLKGTALGQWNESKDKRIFLQDETGTIMMLSRSSQNLKPGDQIEATGIPDIETTLPILRYTQFRRLDHKKLPVPEPLTSFQNLKQSQPTLVQVEATLRFSRQIGEELQMILQLEDHLFEARVRGVPTNNSKAILPGSKLSLTGILLRKGSPLTFLEDWVVLLPTPNDFTVLSPPSWWTKGRIVTVTGTLSIVFLGGLLWVIALRNQVKEQTEVIRKELETESSLEKRYHMVWDISADGMYMTDKQGILVQVNNAFCQMVAKKKEELVGQYYTIIHSESQQAKLLDNYRKDFQTKDILRKNVQDWVLWNGRKACFELSNSFFEQTGGPTYVLSLIRDVTESRHLEEQLRTAQKMEAVGRLAGGVAHDFNNILTVIQGYLGLIKQDERIPHDLIETIEEVEKSAQRATDLTRQLLAFSRRQPLVIQSIDLSELVRNMLRLLERLLGEDIAISFQQHPVQNRIHADSGMMEQVLMNLTVNARDAMPNGGTLFIDVEQVTITPEQAILTDEARPGDFIRLSVKDTGCGMDSTTMARLFEPFFTTKDIGKGTGLGLSTVYGIVKQHHGWIEVASQVGKGTTFRVFLPVYHETEDAAFPMTTSPSTPANGTILLAEDEPTVRQFVQFFLQRQGYKVFAVSNATDALEIWRKCKNMIDLVITDLIMPGNINGRDLGKIIERERPGTPVIYSSGNSLESLPDRTGLEENYNYLCKPFDSLRLARVIKSRLTKPASMKAKNQVDLTACDQKGIH